MSDIKTLRQYLNQQVIGQQDLIDRILIALLADGHLLVEGPPGLAKTRAISALGDCIDGSFQRIQFTPDLLPSDLTGTDIYHPDSGEFSFRKGPLFNNLVLADEVNRAPAKVQSALLEAMAEHQITIGSESYALDELFLVMATQNPIEQEGTYPLPEAQLDRFLLHVAIDYPGAEDELSILRLNRGEAQHQAKEAAPTLAHAELKQARQETLALHMSESVENYIVQLTIATRQPEFYSEKLRGFIEYGCSPRASIALDRSSRALAYLLGRDYVTPEDVQTMAHDVMRHRIGLSFEAEAAGLSPDAIIKQLLELVPAP